MMTFSKSRLAVVGLGMAAKPHLAALRLLHEKVEVSGLYARNAERRRTMAETWGMPIHESLDEILYDSSIDGVIVLTPPSARLEIVRALADAGKPILMEKPVERSLASATEVVEICEAQNVPLGMVLQHRFREAARRCRQLLDEEKLGRLQMVRVNVPWWRDQGYYDEPGRGTYEKDGGGVLLTQAIHPMDLMLSLAGPVRQVQAMTATTGLHRMEAEDFASAAFRLADGTPGALIATTAAYPGRSEVLEFDYDKAALRLERGELFIEWRDGRSERFGEPSQTGGGSDPMDFPCDWHKAVIEDFVDSLRTGKPPFVTGRDALEVHRWIDAIERSAQSGQRVDVST